MTVPASKEPRDSDGRWETIRYALDSNARTLRYCLISLVPTGGLVTALVEVIRHIRLQEVSARMPRGWPLAHLRSWQRRLDNTDRRPGSSYGCGGQGCTCYCTARGSRGTTSTRPGPSHGTGRGIPCTVQGGHGQP